MSFKSSQLIYEKLLLQPPGGAAPSDRSASGLLEWESINDAMEALALMNHYQMKNPGKPKAQVLNPPWNQIGSV